MKLAHTRDLYSTRLYAELYEEKEAGRVEVFDFSSPHGSVKNVFIKRAVPFLLAGKQYYDITSPYGYGGPTIIHSTDIDLLLEDYFKAFHNYCLEQKIVSDFVRFHLFENQEVRNRFDGDVAQIGNHIVRDLTEPLAADMHKSVGQAVRRAERLGVEWVFDEAGDYLDDFLAIYTKTMDLHEAQPFYYFNRSFFNTIQERFPGQFVYAHAFLEGTCIATRLVLFGDTYAYFFLGGALREYSTYKAAILLDYQIMVEMQARGKEYYILGGGYRGEDSLYAYKRKFAEQGQVPFYIGKRIHDKHVYAELEKIRVGKGDFDTGNPFFPSYRS